jgi:hypothetical protein
MTLTSISLPRALHSLCNRLLMPIVRSRSYDLWETLMERFVHNENIALYKKLIAESELNQSRDEGRHAMLLTLLAEENAKERKPRDG